jgi:hypothetical protein
MEQPKAGRQKEGLFLFLVVAFLRSPLAKGAGGVSKKSGCERAFKREAPLEAGLPVVACFS